MRGLCGLGWACEGLVDVTCGAVTSLLVSLNQPLWTPAHWFPSMWLFSQFTACWNKLWTDWKATWMIQLLRIITHFVSMLFDNSDTFEISNGEWNDVIGNISKCREQSVKFSFKISTISIEPDHVPHIMCRQTVGYSSTKLPRFVRIHYEILSGI